MLTYKEMKAMKTDKAMKTYYALRSFYWDGKNIAIGQSVRLGKLDATRMLSRKAVTEDSSMPGA